MKNAIIIGGSGSDKNSFWYPYITKHLKDQKYQISFPQVTKLPNSKKSLDAALQILLSEQFNQHTVLIGHSLGGPLALSTLERISSQIALTIIVAGFCRPTYINGKKLPPPSILQAKYQWKKIKDNSKNIIYINSNNDPWGCNDKEGYYMWKKTGGNLTLLEDEGHMGSGSQNQPYKQFPLLKSIINYQLTINS